MDSQEINNEGQVIKKKSVKKNYIYNLLYQVFLVIVPLISTPYISRVLGADGIGKYSFSFSLITYFTIFASLGFGIYAQRAIAKYQGNIYEQSKSFWEINICRLIPVSIAIVVNIILYLCGIYGDYSFLMLIFTLNILSISLDISFYFQGNEEFGKLVVRNILIKSICVVLIFILVKNPEDLWIYTLINSAMLVFSNISLWGYLKKLIVKVKLKELKPLSHLKGTIKLFIPTIATSIYLVLDKTLIGVLIPGTYVVIENGVEVIKKISDLENGYYEQTEKIVKLVMTIITCLGTVMIPRNTALIASGQEDKVRENIYFSSHLVWLLGMPMVFGLISIAGNFVPWFFGEGYEECIKLFIPLSFLILSIGLSNIFGLQYMVPKGKDKLFSIALLCGAISNLIFNIILIPKYFAMGAAIASIIAETIVTIVMGIMLRKEINMIKIILMSFKYLISGIAMFGITYALSFNLEPSIINTVLIASSGVIVYLVILLIFKEQILIDLIKKINKLVLRK